MKFSLLIVMALAACNPFKDGQATGRLESTGLTGTWVLEKAACFSGERERYFGVVATAPGGIGIKLVKDSIKGWTAVINKADECKDAPAESGSCHAIVLRPEDCNTLAISIENTHTTINSIKVVEGSMTIDCKSGDSSLKGQLTFEGCH